MNARTWVRDESIEYDTVEQVKRAVCSAIGHHRDLMRSFAGTNESVADYSRWHRAFYMRRARRIKAGAA